MPIRLISGEVSERYSPVYPDRSKLICPREYVLSFHARFRTQELTLEELESFLAWFASYSSSVFQGMRTVAALVEDVALQAAILRRRERGEAEDILRWLVGEDWKPTPGDPDAALLHDVALQSLIQRAKGER